jgi:hypothetical protein
MDFPVMASPQPLQLPLGRVPERVGGRGIGSVAERWIGRRGEGGSWSSSCCWGSCGDDCLCCSGRMASSRLSAISDKLPWPIAGSVGESGLKNAAGIGGTSSMVMRMRPGSSRIVCRVRGGSSSTKGPRLRGSVILCRFKLVSDGRLDMELPLELPLRVSDGEDSEDIESSVLSS